LVQQLRLKSRHARVYCLKTSVSRFYRRHTHIAVVRYSCGIGVYNGHESVGNSPVVKITTANESLIIDTIERSEGGTRKIEDRQIVRGHEKYPMSYGGTIRISAYDPIGIVISKQDRSGRIGRIDRKGEGAVASTEIAMRGSDRVHIVTDDLL